MSHLVSKITNLTIAFIVAVFSVNIMGVMTLQTVNAANPGTLKLHEAGTDDGTESTSTKVCVFNFEGFGFVDGQEGYILIDPQGGDSNTTDTETIPFGPAVNGEYVTPYINEVGSGYTIADGHYKSTLYGKDNEDLKAKSKVFKVQCGDTPIPELPTVSVEAGPCVISDTAAGTASGTVTNTNDDTDASVTYTVTATHQVTNAVHAVDVVVADGAVGNFDFTDLAAGTYDLTITGDDGTSAASTTFTIARCDVPVTPAPATHVELCGTENDKYTIPSTTGVTYLVNNVPAGAGTYDGTGTVTVTAVANVGYVLQGTTGWVFNFSDDACDITVTPAAPTSDEKCGTENDIYTIIATEGVKYMVGNTEVTGEQVGTGSVTITAVALPGYVLAQNAVASWTFEFTDEDCPASSITATAVCTREGVLVTLTNAGNADGTVYVNGEAVEVPADSEVEVTVPFDALVFTADVLVELDDEETVLIDKSFDCIPGQGGVNPPAVIVTPAAVPLAPATGLPRTGVDTLAQLITMMTLAIAAYGASFYALNRRKLSDN